jgi:transcriptional regulator with XRE-family HTH domain
MASTEPIAGGSRLKKWLDREGKNQEWLAERLEVSQTTVSAWVRGQSEPRIAFAMKLERLTGIPVAAWARAS